MAMADAERIHPESVVQWRQWLAEHHHDTAGVWLVSWRRETGRTILDYEQTVLEALCFGWIDATTKVLDDERRMMWFTPRSPRSGWARTNKARVDLLQAEGRMQPAGQAVIDVAIANGTWTVLDDAEALIEHPWLAQRLVGMPEARAAWVALSASRRKFHLTQIAMAKQEATRHSRIDGILAELA